MKGVLALEARILKTKGRVQSKKKKRMTQDVRFLDGQRGGGQLAPRAQVGNGPMLGGRLDSLRRKIRMVKVKGHLQRQ